MQCSYHGLYYGINLAGGEFWIHWQRNEFSCTTLGNRECAAAMPQTSISILKMDGYRIVNAATNASGFHVAHE